MNKNDCPQHVHWLRKYLTVNYYTYTVEPPIKDTLEIINLRTKDKFSIYQMETFP